MDKYYHSEDYISHQDKTSNLTNLLYKMVRKFTLKQKVKWLNESAKPKGRLLDYGCGTGYFLKAAKTNGWQVVGVEPNDKAAAIASEKLGQDIFKNTSELEPEKKFDAITLFHVLEHIHDLNSTLELLIAKLKKRGTLFIAVPNYNSPDSHVYQENWASLDVPRHLYHFTPKTMGVLADKFQLKIKNTKPMVFDSYYVSLLSESYIDSKKKIINCLMNGYKSNKLAKQENNNYSSVLFILKKS